MRSLTADEFQRLVELESDTVELKTGLGQKPIQDVLVAMSNTSGGNVYVGVSDAREIVGKKRTQGTDDVIHEAARTAHNVGRYDINEWTIGGTPIIVITIAARHDEVAQTSDGRVLVRQGGRCVAVIGSDLWPFIAQRTLRRYEHADSHVPTRMVDPTIAIEVADAHGWPSGADQEQRWHERGLLAASGSLSIAGALVLTDPHESLGAAKFHVDIRAYENDETESYVRRELATGPVQRQAEVATDWVMRDIGTEMVVTGARRHDVPRLPRRVVREAVANAIAHRDYSKDHAACLIRIRPSAVSITSPGRLPSSVTVATLRESQAPRNHTIIDVLRKFGLAEDSGLGIDIIQDDMRHELLEEPRFIEGADSFTVELPLKGVVTATERGWLAEYERRGDVAPGDRALLLAAIRTGEVTNARARELLGIDSVDARNRLSRLVRAGLLERHGARGRSYYTPQLEGPTRSSEQVLLDAAAEAPLTNARVRELLGLTREQALTILRQMVREGSLQQTGNRRGTKYVLPK